MKQRTIYNVGQWVIVHQDDGILVGQVTQVTHSSNVFYLYQIAVHPDFWDEAGVTVLTVAEWQLLTPISPPPNQ